MAKRFVYTETKRVTGVLIELQDRDRKEHAIKFISHRGLDRLLCDHVYFHFCLECPQCECRGRSV